MTRRCQVCIRLFQGETCPECGEDYREPEVELDGVRIKPKPKVPHASKGTCKQEKCRRCGAETPKTRGNWQWCNRCRPIVRREACREANRRHRAKQRDAWWAAHPEVEQSA